MLVHIYSLLKIILIRIEVYSLVILNCMGNCIVLSVSVFENFRHISDTVGTNLGSTVDYSST